MISTDFVKSCNLIGLRRHKTPVFTRTKEVIRLHLIGVKKSLGTSLGANLVFTRPYPFHNLELEIGHGNETSE